MMIIVKNDLVTFKVIAVGLFQNALNLKVLTQYLKIIKNLLQKNISTINFPLQNVVHVLVSLFIQVNF